MAGNGGGESSKPGKSTQTKFKIEQNVPSGSVKKGPYAVERSVDPNDVVIKRRFGEGSKPLFARDDVAVNRNALADDINTIATSNNAKQHTNWRPTRQNSTDSSSPERYRQRDTPSTNPHPSHPQVSSKFSTSERKLPASSSRKQRTPENKIPYYADEMRERDRLKRLYGSDKKSDFKNHKDYKGRHPKSPSRSASRSRTKSPLRRGHLNHSSTSSGRAFKRHRNSPTRTRHDATKSQTHSRHRSATSQEHHRSSRRHSSSDSEKRRTSEQRRKKYHSPHSSHSSARRHQRHSRSLTRSRTHSRSSSRTHSHSRERHERGRHGGRPRRRSKSDGDDHQRDNGNSSRAHERQDHKTEVSTPAPQIITIPVPVPEYFAYSSWPLNHHWGSPAPHSMPAPSRFVPPPAYALMPPTVMPSFRPPPYAMAPYGPRPFRPQNRYNYARPPRGNYRPRHT